MSAAEPITELITIGREILDGRVIDTNAVAIAEALRTIGLTPRYGQRVDDELDRIVKAFEIAEERSRIVLVTGGLGPTSDDMTAQAFARFLGEPLVLNDFAFKQISALFEKYQRPLTEVQKKQALLPPSCFVLENTEGTAPGFGLERNGVSWFFMPGVPREMKAMLRREILHRLPAIQGYKTMTWATQFTSEGTLQQKLAGVEAKLPNGFEITYRTRYPENHIGLYGSCASAQALRSFETLSHEITGILDDDVFSTASDSEQLRSLEEVVLSSLLENRFVLGTVESCTGGLVASRITDVPGASNAFWGSFVAYDYAAKESQLGLPAELLKNHGAVSKEVAQALAELGLRKMRESLRDAQVHAITGWKDALCVSTTGIAGPSGGTNQKPVGLCYIALARPGHETVVEELRSRFNLDRERNKLFFAQKALDLVRRQLLPPPRKTDSK